MSEAKAGLKARVEAELAAAANDEELKSLRDRFSAEERGLEHSIDHQVHQFSAALDVRRLLTTHTHCPTHQARTNATDNTISANTMLTLLGFLAFLGLLGRDLGIGRPPRDHIWCRAVLHMV